MKIYGVFDTCESLVELHFDEENANKVANRIHGSISELEVFDQQKLLVVFQDKEFVGVVSDLSLHSKIHNSVSFIVTVDKISDYLNSAHDLFRIFENETEFHCTKITLKEYSKLPPDHIKQLIRANSKQEAIKIYYRNKENDERRNNY